MIRSASFRGRQESRIVFIHLIVSFRIFFDSSYPLPGNFRSSSYNCPSDRKSKIGDDDTVKRPAMGTMELLLRNACNKKKKSMLNTECRMSEVFRTHHSTLGVNHSTFIPFKAANRLIMVNTLSGSVPIILPAGWHAKGYRVNARSIWRMLSILS